MEVDLDKKAEDRQRESEKLRVRNLDVFKIISKDIFSGY